MNTSSANQYRRVVGCWTKTALTVGLLSGCASFSADGGFNAVQTQTQARLGQQVSWARNDEQRAALTSQVNDLLAKPLDESGAVQIALLNNRSMQASFEEMGISEAQVVQAGTLPNPGFSFGKFRRGDEREIERGIHFNLARVLFMPLLKSMAQRQFSRTQADVSGQVLSLAGETRKAYYDAVAAQERLQHMREVKKTADTGALLAQRMAAVGNLNKIDQAREQGFYAEAVVNLARAMRTNHSAREKLIRLMGLWGEQINFQLPDGLPEIPDAPLELPNAEQIAMEQRLDLQSARLDIERIGKNLSLTRINRFVNVLEIGYARETSNLEPTRSGYEVSFEIPIFNFSGAKTRMAKAQYMQAVHLTAQAAINARSEVREAYINYRTAYDIARLYRDEIVPTKKRVSEEKLYRYNGMIIGVFELFADARAQVTAVDSSIQALRDFWAAKADLDMAMIGKPSFSSMTAPASAGMASDSGAGH